MIYFETFRIIVQNIQFFLLKMDYEESETSQNKTSIVFKRLF